LALSQRDNSAGAIDAFQKAIELDPNESDAHSNLGAEFAKLGQFDVARHELEAAVRLNPQHFQARHNLGLVLIDLGDTSAAITEFEAALQLEPNAADTHRKLAEALAATQQWPQAQREFEAALSLRPESWKAWHGLAKVLIQTDRLPQGMAAYGRAMQLGPGAPAFADLAWLLATHPSSEIRDVAGATRLANLACEQTNHRDARSLQSLAAAQAAAGEFDSAVATLDQAIKRTKQGFDEPSVEELQALRTKFALREPAIQDPTQLAAKKSGVDQTNRSTPQIESSPN
jgi:tetratricopeptide (TPR) repeat protein